MSDEVPTGFLAAVCDWMLSRGIKVGEVLSVTSNSTDWAGSTEDGFHSEFSIDIAYSDHNAKPRTYSVEGDEMALLWAFVVQGWRP